MPEVKASKDAIFKIKSKTDFRVCMKPIHRAGLIKYIILVSITTDLCGISEYA
jgi:hypothetical protein